MNPEDKQKPESQGASLRSEGSRKPYCPPRLRSLGKVALITGYAGDGARKKPNG
jgi:hypothetical protein